MTTEEVRIEIEKVFVRECARRGMFGLTRDDAGKEFSTLFGRTTVIAVILYVVAYMIVLKSQLFAVWKREVEALWQSSRYGTWVWWIETAKKWQKGDATVVTDGVVGYESVDESKQIIKAAMVRQNGRSISVYVAKGTDAELSPLAADELTAFQSYLNNVKPLGINVLAISLPADSIEVSGEVVYSNELLQNEMKDAVKDRLNEYFRSLSFGATVYVAQMIEEVMSIDGVVDTALTMKVNGEVIEREKVLPAGYGVADVANVVVKNNSIIRRYVANR